MEISFWPAGVVINFPRMYVYIPVETVPVWYVFVNLSLSRAIFIVRASPPFAGVPGSLASKMVQ